MAVAAKAMGAAYILRELPTNPIRRSQHALTAGRQPHAPIAATTMTTVPATTGPAMQRHSRWSQTSVSGFHTPASAAADSGVMVMNEGRPGRPLPYLCVCGCAATAVPGEFACVS